MGLKLKQNVERDCTRDTLFLVLTLWISWGGKNFPFRPVINGTKYSRIYRVNLRKTHFRKFYLAHSWILCPKCCLSLLVDLNMVTLVDPLRGIDLLGPCTKFVRVCSSLMNNEDEMIFSAIVRPITYKVNC